MTFLRHNGGPCIRPRRIFGSLLAAATLGAAAFISSATAGAVPVWDLDHYDKCLDGMGYFRGSKSWQEKAAIRQFCCQLSGGEWGPPSPIEGNRQCVAPAPEANPSGQPGQPTAPPARPPVAPLTPGPANPG